MKHHNTTLAILAAVILGALYLAKERPKVHAEGTIHYKVVSFKSYKNELQLQNLLNHFSNSGWQYLGATPQKTGGIFKKKTKAKFVPVIIILGDKNGRPYLGVFTKESKEGMVVNKVEFNGPSSQAGIQLGCVFLEIDGLKATQENFRNTLKALTNRTKTSFLIKARQSHGVTYFRAVLP
jgi:predicted metalloprotease with PDZ domain